MFALYAEFTGTAPEDVEFEQPSGASVARVIQANIEAAGWAADEFENFRDFGWVIDCRQPSVEVEIVIGEIASGEWFARVAPRHAPGLIGRLLRREPSATREDVLRAARVVHASLVAQLTYSNLQWQWTPDWNRDLWSAEPLPSGEAS